MLPVLWLLWCSGIHASRLMGKMDPEHANSSSRMLIINGKPATDGSWVVKASCCGATVLSRDMILTAEHCLCFNKIGESVQGNIMDLSNPSPDVQRSKIVETRSGPRDIRLARIHPPFTVTPNDEPGLHQTDLPFSKKERLVSNSGIWFCHAYRTIVIEETFADESESKY